MAYRFTIQRKLNTLSAVALVLFLTLTSAGGWAIYQLSLATEDITNMGSALKHQLQVDMMHDAMRGDVLAALSAGSKNDAALDATLEPKIKAEKSEHGKRFQDSLKRLESLPLDETVLGATANLRPVLDSYERIGDELVSLAFTDNGAAQSRYSEFRLVFGQLESAMGELSNLIEDSARSSLEAAQKKSVFARNVFIAVTLIASTLLFLLGVLISRSISRPIQKAVGFAQAIAGGDLTSHIEKGGTDETGQLLQALNDMRASLLRTVGQVKQTTDGITLASAEIASGNLDLSGRTEQAASSLEEAAASMEQLTATVRQSADSARQANQLASSASEIATRGGSVVGQVVATMDEINSSSRKISDIIAVIDGIAFQTNILALNAAVEAARAGEQGRGFAVVAAEVRSLAQRSAEAAKEIKGLIGNSVGKVEAGSRLVADAGKTMNEIVSSVQRVKDIIGEITAAASEQSQGIAQINTVVSQLDQMTQQNAALVEQSAAAAESLKDQAEQLAQVVRVFKLDRAQTVPVLVAPRPAPVLAKAPAPKPLTVAPRQAAAKTQAASGDDDDWESF